MPKKKSKTVKKKARTISAKTKKKSPAKRITKATTSTAKQESSTFSFWFKDKNYTKSIKGEEICYLSYKGEFASNDRLKVSTHTYKENFFYDTDRQSAPPPKALANRIDQYVEEFKRAGKGAFYWKVFYEHTTFENILEVLACYFPNKYFELPLRKDFLKDFEVQQITNDNKLTKQLLKVISEHPKVLLNSKIALLSLIKIIETAQYSPISEKSRRAKDSLMDNLVPSHQGGKKMLPDKTTLKLARKIMVKLAEHLSKKCKDYDVNLKDSFEWEHGYKMITNEINDNRISCLQKNSLEELIIKPTRFVDKKIKNILQIGERKLKTILTATD